MPIRRIGPALAGASLALLALGACVPRAEAPPPLPAPAPAPPPVALPPSPAAPIPPPTDWTTGRLSAGDWAYRLEARGSTAVFGGSGYGPSLAISCTSGQIGIVLTGMEGSTVIVRTSFGERRLPAVHDRGQTAVTPQASELLDQMAFSRGRFLVTVEGGPSLVVPAWPEFARVVEDCRGR